MLDYETFFYVFTYIKSFLIKKWWIILVVKAEKTYCIYDFCTPKIFSVNKNDLALCT